MSKKYKGKPCAYCGAVATTEDHLFARSFFPVEQRANPIKVPACARCNKDKSDLEHYLSVIVPMGSANEAIHADFAPRFKSRLDKDRALERELMRGLERHPATNGRPGQSFMHLRGGYLENYAGWLVRGLLAHHFGVIGGYVIRSDIIRLEALPIVDQLLLEQEELLMVVDGELPGVRYRGGVAKVDPRSSTWYVFLHGGLRVGNSGKPGEISLIGFRAMTLSPRWSANLEPRDFPFNGACVPIAIRPRMDQMALFFSLDALPGACDGGAPCYLRVARRGATK